MEPNPVPCTRRLKRFPLVVSRPPAVVSRGRPLRVLWCRRSDRLHCKVLGYRSLKINPGDTASGWTPGAVGYGSTAPVFPLALSTALVRVLVELRFSLHGLNRPVFSPLLFADRKTAFSMLALPYLCST